MDRTKIVLITGASSGIGRACVAVLAEHGCRVYGTSRNPTERDVSDLDVTLLPMNVDDTPSVTSGIQRILDEAGRLDVVINNAGFGYGGAVEDTSIEEAKALFETNFFGVLRVCHAVLPTMRAQKQGLIINVSSIGGLMGLPYQGLYSASKFALEGLTEALRMELRPFGVHATLLEPGDIRTGFTANRRHTAASQVHNAYMEQYATALTKIEADEQGGADPEVVGRAIWRIINRRAPNPRYVVGPFYEKLAVIAKAVLPSRWFERVVMMNYGL